MADDSKVVRVKTGRLVTAHNYQVLMADDGLDVSRHGRHNVATVLNRSGFSRQI